MRLGQGGPLLQDLPGGWRSLLAADIDNNLILPQATAWTTPPAGNLAIVAAPVAGQPQLSFTTPDGVHAELQTAMWADVDLLVSGGATYNQIGTGSVSVAAGTAGAIASTSYRTSLVRTVHTSAATAGSAQGVRIATANRWFGNAAGLGGFHAVIRHALTLLAGHQAFVGQGPAATLAGEPTALVNMLGIGADAADTNLFLMHKAATGTATKVDTGLAKTTADVLRLTLYAPPNSTSATVQLYNETTRAQVGQWTVTTNLPANTAFMAPQAQVRNGATTTACAIEVIRIRSGAPAR